MRSAPKYPDFIGNCGVKNFALAEIPETAPLWHDAVRQANLDKRTPRGNNLPTKLKNPADNLLNNSIELFNDYRVG